MSYFLKSNKTGGLHSLFRRSQSPPEAPYNDGGRDVPVCRIVEKFTLEFLDNNAKKEHLSNTVPAAIIINFVLNLEGEKESFMTMVRPVIASGS